MHGPNISPDSFLGRLKSHKVIEWTLAYAALGYTLLHGVEMLSEAQSWPHVIVRVLSLVLILGVPIIATLAWYHGAKGLKKISGPELAILTVLLFMAGTLLWVLSGTGTQHQTAQVEHSTPATETASAAKPAPAASAATPTAPRTAVAVMPFANLTGDASKEYLGDGMAEELINTLTKVQGLRVPARTSTFSYKGRNTDAKQIAKDLSVGTILEGSIRSAGSTIRITAQLIDAQTDSHLWSETYDRKFTDLFKLQDELAKAIVQALQVNLHGAAPESVTQAPPTQDVEAYNLYLQGWSLVHRPNEQNDNLAIEYFQQAIARDPKFARAYAGIAEANMELAEQLGVRPVDNLAAAERAAQKALSLDSTLANGHTALAGISGSRGQLLEMESHGRMAVSLAANDGFIQSIRGIHLAWVGHFAEALQAGQKAYALAPTNPFVVGYLAYFHLLAGHDAEALKYAGLAADLGATKDSGVLPTVYWRVALREKHYAEAGAVFSKTFDAANPDWAGTAEIARLVFTALRDPAQRPAALAARSRLHPKSSEATMAHIGPCLESGFLYTLLDALDVAYELASQCLDQRAPAGLVTTQPLQMMWIPEMSPFRRDARFQAFVTRLGFMEYYQQYGSPDDCELKNNKLTCH